MYKVEFERGDEAILTEPYLDPALEPCPRSPEGVLFRPCDPHQDRALRLFGQQGWDAHLRIPSVLAAKATAAVLCDKHEIRGFDPEELCDAGDHEGHTL